MMHLTLRREARSALQESWRALKAAGRVVMSRFKLILVALLACAVAGAVLAQNADQNTSGPTRNDYRLRLVQPLEGASIVGDRIQVIVDTEIPAERDTRSDVNSMPRPRIDVFLDDLYQGTMHDGENVIDLDNVAPGPHEIVLLGKNLSGEIIDRRVVHLTATAPKVVKAAVPAPAAPAPAPPPYVAPAPEPVYAPPAETPVEELPKSGTSDPLLLTAGVLLLAAGFVVRRFR
jgi:LPXTG-motif cell wall-anchored protein